MPRTPPNICLIHVDQLRYDCIGPNGASLAPTPNLDRLAAEGMVFSHAFCAIPVCVPVRNSMLYGCWPSRHLCIGNRSTEAPRPPDSSLPSYDRILKSQGYRLMRVGKIQEGPAANDPGAFDEILPESEYHRWRRDMGLPPRPSSNGWFGEPDPGISPEQSRLSWGADAIIDMLASSAADERPFFIRWDPSEPHLPNVVPEPYASMIPAERVPAWGSFADSLADKPYIQAQQQRTWGLDHMSWEDWAPTVARYLGEVALMDVCVGRILDALDRLGLADETVLVFTTDHGDLCGGHGLIDKHFVMYEDVTHLPLIIRWPGHVQPGSRCSEFVVTSIDLARTFCELAGGVVPDTFQGVSLLPALNGEGGTGRLDVFSMYHASQFGLYSQRMVRDRRWKYVWNATACDELYDLEEDPFELCNRHREPECAAELARLRRRLVAWMEEVADPLLNQWTRTQLLEGRSL